MAELSAVYSCFTCVYVVWDLICGAALIFRTSVAFDRLHHALCLLWMSFMTLYIHAFMDASRDLVRAALYASALVDVLTLGLIVEHSSKVPRGYMQRSVLLAGMRSPFVINPSLMFA